MKSDRCEKYVSNIQIALYQIMYLALLRQFYFVMYSCFMLVDT